MKRWYAAGGVLLLLACVLCGVFVWRTVPRETAETTVREALAKREAEAPEPEAAPEPEPELYESPIDFPALWELNPDIYAWIQIPDTEVSYPILQREGDDSYYLRRDSAGSRDQRGCIFTESAYNGKAFTDPVTVVYGHYMTNGTMFGSLQTTYTTQEGMAEQGEIVIYLPDGEQRYQVFAGVPYSNAHILYYHDFSDSEEYLAFLDPVRSTRSMNANVDESVEVGAEDQLLILSTCLRGDNQQRYLVLAKRTA